MRPFAATLVLVLAGVSACAPHPRRGVDPLVDASNAYFGTYLWFRGLTKTAGMASPLVVEVDGRPESWDVVVFEWRYARDSTADYICADVYRGAVARRRDGGAVLEMGGEDFAERLAPKQWCGNDRGHAAPYLSFARFSSGRAHAVDGAARLEVLGSSSGGCFYRYEDPAHIGSRVDCERVAVLVAIDATIESGRSRARIRTLGVAPQIVPGLLLTLHCNERLDLMGGIGGCARRHPGPPPVTADSA